MPYKFSTHHIKLPRKFDRRVKIKPCHKRAIHACYKSGMAIRAIARRFKLICSRRAIYFILFPEKLKHNAALHKIRRKDGRYYHPETWPSVMREHCRYKQKILKSINKI